MIGAIAGQQGFDSKGKNILTVLTTTTSSSYVDALNIVGKGYLMDVQHAYSGGSGAAQSFMKMVLDGATKFDGQAIGSSYGGSIGLTPICRFESGVKIQHRVGIAGQGSTLLISYFLD